MDRPIALFELASLSPEARERLLVRSEADLAVFEERVKPIIEEVRRDGDAALARFGARFDGATGLKPDAIRTPGARVRRGDEERRAGGDRGARIRGRQRAALSRGAAAGRDVDEGNAPRHLRRRALVADRFRRLLRAARQGLVPLGRGDDGGAGDGRQGAARHHLHAAAARRPHRSRDPGGGEAGGRDRGLSLRRGPGGRGRRLWHRDGAARAQDGGAGQPLPGGGEEAAVAPDRPRHPGRAVGIHHPGGRDGGRAAGRPRPADRGGARAGFLLLPGHQFAGRWRRRRGPPSPASGPRCRTSGSISRRPC